MRISDWSSDVCSSDLMWLYKPPARNLASADPPVEDERLRGRAAEMDEHWSVAAHRHFTAAGVRQVAYVPDAGLTRLIERCREDNAIETVMCRSEEHTSELQSLMRISYAVFCLKKNINN